MQEDIRQIMFRSRELDSINLEENFSGIPSLILGYISPDLDFQSTVTKLRQKCRSSVLICTSTAGELCSRDLDRTLPLYQEADESRGSIVLQGFSEQIIDKIDVKTIELHDPDMEANERTSRIKKELDTMTPSFKIDHKHCIAFTLIDGLSRSESFYMEALYESGKLPCLTIGGSAGGKLDFQNTYLYNNKEVVQNKAVVTLIRFRNDIGMGIFKSQNFEMTPFSMTIAQANPAKRYIKSIIDPQTGDLKDVISYLCSHFNCSESELENYLQNFSFAIKIHDDIYVRSISMIDFKERRIHFYCDLAFGDELYLVKHTDFIQSVNEDYRRFSRNKDTAPLGAVFNDCILRRLFNGEKLSGVDCFQDVPVAGFSTFGELLGVNINQTLTALFLYRIQEGEEFHDEYIDNFIIKYSGFKEFFLQRRLNQMNNIVLIKDRVWETSRKSIDMMSDFIEESKQKAIESDRIIELINRDFENLYSRINQSKDEGLNISRELEHLGRSANSVETVLYDIVDIAGQTNILGFNASIEAARAGKSRGGFSVIAKEVKKLADKTQEHVKISKEAVSDVIKRMDTLKFKVGQINENQINANSLSSEINSSINQLTSSSRTIENEMSSHTTRIKGLMDHIDQMLQTINTLE